MSDDLIEAVAKAICNDMGWHPYVGSLKEAEKAVRAALSAIEAAGFVIAPVEPTDEMKNIDISNAFQMPCCMPAPGTFRPDIIYTAMLSARPKVTT